MLPNDDGVEYLLGSAATFHKRTFAPYDPLVCDFLGSLSTVLRESPEAKAFPDALAFAFWCRGRHLAKLKEQFANRGVRLGLGIVFHITPSNVPVNFAFSFAFALLAGNANIVRVPSKHFAQTGLIVGAIKKVLADPQYQPLAASTAFVQYEKNDAVTAAFSRMCQGRIIWGGNRTIQSIRQLPLPARAREIAFADRYSLCALEAGAVRRCDSRTLARLAEGFYNDTYLMDQNACSSPHLVLWLGTEQDVAAAQPMFWEAVHRIASDKYALAPISAVDKFTHFCEDAIALPEMAGGKRYGNFLYVLQLKQLPQPLDEIRGTCGYFYEYAAADLNEIAPFVTETFQTLTYFGLDKNGLVSFVEKNQLAGIDRIVPVGQAMDISLIWDGYDLVDALSRICDIQ